MTVIKMNGNRRVIAYECSVRRLLMAMVEESNLVHEHKL